MKNSQTAVTKEQVASALKITIAVTEAIREARQIPEGTLYATLLGRVDLAGFERMLAIIIGSGLVERRNHLLRWIGPEVGY